MLNHTPDPVQGSQVPPVDARQYSSTSIDALARHSRITSATESAMTPSPMATRGAVKALSPQLVVPDDCECALVLRMPASGWRGSFDICDTRGSAVLQVFVQDTTFQSQKALEIQLGSSFVPSSVVARCRLLKAGKISTFCVYQKDSDEMFATVTSEAVGRARLVVAAGGYFDIIREDQDNVRVLDEQRQLHGTSETYVPPADSPIPNEGGMVCLVRVGPLSDAGLVLCGLMCLHQLDLASMRG